MIDDKAPIARLRQALFSWFIVVALVLSWFGSTVATSATVATGASAGLAGAVAQDSVATLSSAWKATRALELRSSHDPDEFGAPVSPTGPTEGLATEAVWQTEAVLRIASDKGLPQSRAPPLT